ncbi:winged helix-turn-helix transcriptional regulator [Parvularcula sp. ZS-1/3]|uniref:Winged helix-turn-helix transcriptional regulator n=1 Tax=Parvularcula mediterranea TaxID=2732508 RepID=A0A7Y3RNA9_9PROT|nr:metalloregulator ArsR/SmtB family transcription factor [Parvularcula mediterranea]NNU16422.1 winged helix-turn-helix transcriptional regulator [Parvularcula mediterranea]
MVEEQHLDAIFQALSDPSRRRMLAALSAGEASVSSLAAPLDMSLAGASKHVQVLERAGLVSRRKVGRQQILALEAKRLREARDWLERYARFWADALDALETALEEETKR